MEWRTFLMLGIFLFSVVSAGPKEEFGFDQDWAYQDLLIKGELIHEGNGPKCAPRYAALKPLLDKFKRPFTVLDIGANNGYFSFKIAQDYDATCVMIDGTDRLQKICEKNEHPRVVYLKKFLKPKDIERLAETEHFDVVLCFHVLHHVDWRRFVPALFKLGDHVVIETPPVNDGYVSVKPTIPEIAQYLSSLPDAVKIGSFERQSPEILDHMYLFSHPLNTPLARRSFEAAEKYDRRKKKWVSAPRGISLKTFEKLKGAYPANFGKE